MQPPSRRFRSNGSARKGSRAVAIEVGNKVVRKGRTGRQPGEVVAVHPEAYHGIAVVYPGQPIAAYYAEDELDVVTDVVS
jgi:hypothetical protein